VEPLAFVEVLGRHGDVLTRYPVYRWPARSGRGYDMDVILDDPFVAPRHVQIEPVADGRFKVSDLQSVNGFSLSSSGQRVGTAEVGPEDVVRLGQTQIRIREPSYAVRPELALRATALYRRPLAFAVMAAGLLGLVVWSAWIMTASRDEKAFLVFPAIGVCVGVGAWIAIWSLVGRTVGGRANFAAHGFVASAGLIALGLADTMIDYLSFGFNAGWLKYVAIAALAAIFAYMIYRHLRLNSRAPQRSLGIAAAIASVAVCGAFAGLEMAGDSTREGRLPYDETLKPPAFLWVTGVAPAAFLAEGERLRHKVDAVARTEP
jgi:hypothetical protein